jgi:hypothetical protein
MKRLLGFWKWCFYNCALVLHTFHRHKSVKSSFKIEKRLGRLRNKVQEYQSRTIDIDLIARFRNYCYRKLEIPHPLMQNRNFVLLPIQDLNLDWKHPILQKKYWINFCFLQIKAFRLFKIYEVLTKYCFRAIQLCCFRREYRSRQTTLATKFLRILMQNSFERFADNFYLNFIKIKTDAFPLEMSFYDRYQQLSDDLAIWFV